MLQEGVKIGGPTNMSLAYRILKSFSFFFLVSEDWWCMDSRGHLDYQRAW